MREEEVYKHDWNAGNVVIWDNRPVLHRGLAYDTGEHRVMHRVTVSGDGVKF